jgi:thiol-disulfide isomerase/thioredoxin
MSNLLFKVKEMSLLPFIFLFSLILCPFATQNIAQTRKSKRVIVKKNKALVLQKLPVVTRIDSSELSKLIKSNGKPMLLNFWATWCEPCVKEFPDLVKIDEMFHGRIDFYTISMDELSEIDQDVPKFLAKVNAKMPAYLLKTEDESSAISMVSKKWRGGLPFTVLFDENGVEIFSANGIVKPLVLKTKIESLFVK